MSFRKAKAGRRKLMLFPLMDVFFILLIFFLAIAAIKIGKPAEKGAVRSNYAYTPVAEKGEAHVLIQVNSQNNTFTWLDSESREIIDSKGVKAPELTHPLEQLRVKVQAFCAHAEKCSAGLINIAVRCPNDLPYGTVWDIQKTLRETIEGDGKSPRTSKFFVHVSLLPGSLNDIVSGGQNGDTVDIAFSQQGGK